MTKWKNKNIMAEEYKIGIKKERRRGMKAKVIRMKNNVVTLIHRGEAFLIKRRYVSGVTVIEMVLILVIIIALLLIFKNQLTSLINTIFDKITSESSRI